MMRLHQDAQIARNHNRTMQTEERPNPEDRQAPEAFLSRKEVALRFGVSLSTVTRWARTGLIRAVRTPGGHYRYPATALIRALPTSGVDAASPEQGGPHERHPRTQ
jgi:excisionase family DNA binding protein